MKKLNKTSSLLWLGLSKSLLLILLTTSCSLKYQESVAVEDRVPELIFEESHMTRYEDNKPTFEMSAELMEQYKDNKESYGKNISFTSRNKDGDVTTEGSCGVLYIDNDNKVYELYDNIELDNHEENMKFYADVLRWNEKTEQLTSGRGNMVKVEKDDTIIRGSGFSASGVSKEFSFRGNVTGNIETDDAAEDTAEETTEDDDL